MHNEQGLTFENPHPRYLHFSKVKVSGPTELLCSAFIHSTFHFQTLPRTQPGLQQALSKCLWDWTEENPLESWLWTIHFSRSSLKGYWGVKEGSLSILNTTAQLCFQPSVEAGLKKEKERKPGRSTKKANTQERAVNTRSPADRVRERGSWCASYPKGPIWLESLSAFPGIGKEEGCVPWHPLGTVSGRLWKGGDPLIWMKCQEIRENFKQKLNPGLRLGGDRKMCLQLTMICNLILSNAHTHTFTTTQTHAFSHPDIEITHKGVTHNPWLIHVNVWQKPLQYCKVISLQLITINGKKKSHTQCKHTSILHFTSITVTFFPSLSASPHPSPFFFSLSWILLALKLDSFLYGPVSQVCSILPRSLRGYPYLWTSGGRERWRNRAALASQKHCVQSRHLISMLIIVIIIISSSSSSSSNTCQFSVSVYSLLGLVLGPEQWVSQFFHR